MTNDNELTAKAISESLDRRLAAIRAEKAKTLIPGTSSGRIYRPRTRRTSVPHRSIR